MRHPRRIARGVLALIVGTVVGCARTENRATPADVTPGPIARSVATTALVNRVWTRADSTGMPGVLRVFTGDGTLIMDSCWETYRLAAWRAESDSAVVWQEDGVDVRATIVAVDAATLVLRVGLVSESEEQHYRVAAAPYVCPDMVR